MLFHIESINNISEIYMKSKSVTHMAITSATIDIQSGLRGQLNNRQGTPIHQNGRGHPTLFIWHSIETESFDESKRTPRTPFANIDSLYFKDC